MAKPSNINSLADSYKNESSKYDSYGTDPGIISVGSTIIRDVTRKKIFQNDQGSWTEVIEVDRNVFESGPESIEKGVVGETKRRIADYNVVLGSLDKKVLSINADINAAKVGIISQINSARVSHGCSISEFTDTFDTPLKINGVVVGIGSTLFGDTARYKHYPNLSDPLNDNPFELDRTDILTLSNVGSGYESINTNNDRVNGSNYGVYQVVNAWLNNQLAGTDTDCQACVDEIKRLAAQIGTLRPQRAIHMKDINLLKKSKLSDEISHWAYQREAQIVKAKQNELLKTVSALSDVTLEVASIQQDGLLFHFDARDSASFDSSRTDWRDLSDNNYHSEVIGEHVSWASTERAFQFNKIGATSAIGLVKGEGMFISGLKYGSGSVDQLANLTIEAWIKAESTNTDRGAVDYRSILSYDGSEVFRFGLGATSHLGKPTFEFTNNQGTTNVICTDGDDLRDNKWHQVAVTFASSDTGFDDNPSVSLGIGNTDGTQVSQIKFYVDGQLVQTISDVTETAHNPIGNQTTIDTANPWVRSGPHVGWSTFMNNLAVYPSNTETLTGTTHTNTWSFDISKDSSNFFLDVQGDNDCTVKFDGVDVTNDFSVINTDHISTFNISNLITSNKVGSHTIVGTVANWFYNTGNVGSCHFDGVSDRLDVESSSDFAFGTNDFTIEAWIRTGTSTVDGVSERIIYKTDGPTGNHASNLVISVDTNGFIKVHTSPNTVVLSTTAIADNEWHHIAVTRTSGTSRIFVDGVLENTGTHEYTVTANSGSPRPRIGSWDGTNGDFHGQISNLRVLNGTALYTSSFESPTEPLINITNTVLLCCQNSESVIIEETGKTITNSAVGTNSSHPFIFGNGTAKQDWDTNPAGIAFRLRDNDDNVIIRSGDSVRYGWIGNGSETSFPGIARTDTGVGNMWFGFIGRIAMYNKTLTETQIEDHFDIYKTDYDLSADIVTIEWISTAFDKSDGGTLSARVKFNADVDVTGTPQLSVTNGNQGSGSGRGPHLLNFASGSGTSDLVFSLAIGANNAATNASDVLSIAANSVSLNSGSIKNKGTDIIATLSHSTKIGFDAGVIVVSA